MTTVDELLKKNKFSKKEIYRIEDKLMGYQNYVYVGRSKYGVVVKRPKSKEKELLNLFDKKSKVKRIKL